MTATEPRLSSTDLSPAAGRVESIHIADENGGPMRPLTRARVRAGVGIEGDRYAIGAGQWSDHPGGDRDLTLVEAEVIDSLAAEHGISLAPGETRRNVTTRGVRLDDLVGREFTIGDVRCQGQRRCEPCAYLQDIVGKPLLKPMTHRGGLRALILTDGEFGVGDAVTPLA
ncbi:MAG: MOSC domain-containing protein [Candidatus Limnocylindria bacterium]